MNKILFFLFFLFSSSFVSGQTDTIRLEKEKIVLYRCTSPRAQYWYLKQIDEQYILVNLTLSPDEVADWFNRYANSQNLYRSRIIQRYNLEFFQFRKSNFPEETLNFEITERTEEEIVTLSIETGEEFRFYRLEF